MRKTVMAELNDRESSVVCKDPAHSTPLRFLKLDPFLSPPSEGQCPLCIPTTFFHGPSTLAAAT